MKRANRSRDATICDLGVFVLALSAVAMKEYALALVLLLMAGVMLS